MSLLNATTYHPLTENSAVELALSLKLFCNNTKLNCKEIGDGNLNLVFHIVDEATNKGIIIKQALPYAKVVGESWPLTLKRAKIEADALKVFGHIVPDYVPEVYYTDDVLAVTVMEDLSHLAIARSGFINGETYPLLSKHIGEYLAKTLFFTSDYALGPQLKKEQAAKFINPELCNITEDLIFTDPYYDAETNDFEESLRSEVQSIWNDGELKYQISVLKKSFLTEAEVLLHGDLHTGSIFASSTETKVIDPEFAFYGPAGFDIGQVFANLLFQVIASSEKKEIFIHHIQTVWNVFDEQFTVLWEIANKDDLSKSRLFLDHLKSKYFEDAVGFAGCELIRRTIGLSHVADLDKIVDDQTRINAKQNSLKLGKTLIKQRKGINRLEILVDTVKKALQ
ncbi:S-methyl-5-thioribose kinase [Bacillus sp. MRMR6]|uniref:S-methyl-5-thioribose kinase n=1 Tax=Bacillus sp. MRMR6 TaxID=1928617 RepID=UPI00095346B7|nr:S-methyl-5-thioribose kinase [Bacillus sp. MRMR6]OLS41894.1 S-methyl-5-thioribose kinase [Bacillus sp. MRMR6]